MSSIKLYFLLGLVAYFNIVTAIIETPTKLDLSFLHRVKSSTLVTAIKQTIDKSKEIEIDVSSSLIEKDLKEFISLLAKNEATSITLKARSNQWSQQEVAMLLKAITDKDNTIDKDSDAAGTKERNTEDERKFPFVLLDLAWNNLGPKTRDSKSFLKALQTLVEESRQSRTRNFVLRLDVCGLGPAACRAIGKGIIERYGSNSQNAENIMPLSLHLTGNENIGDAGVAALAAAIRSVASKNKGICIFDTMDLSACDISDTGTEALALALENNPLCVRHLILSNNKISDDGAAALGRALSSSRLETLDLSNNKDITDTGASAISDVLEKGTVGNLVIRSCNIQADGISSIAKVLKNLGETNGDRPESLQIDLSGNPLGILRKKSKSSAYSATALRSKATKTTAAYVSLIGKRVQKGLKEFGLSESSMGSTLESDDEEETQMGHETKSSDQSETKCGALAFADTFIDTEGKGDNNAIRKSEVASDSKSKCDIKLALRHCYFDTRAAEAFAAVVQVAKDTMEMDIKIDISMTDVLEDEMIAALGGDKAFQSELDEMAERHLEAMEALRLARKRALEAAKAAAARLKAEAEMEAAWGSPMDMGDDSYNDDAFDFEADYDYDYDRDVDDY